MQIEAESERAIAREAHSCFMTDKRSNGEEFVHLKYRAAKWLKDAVMAAHGEMMPDDERYLMIRQTCATLAEAEDWDDLTAEIDNDVDVYNVTLARWLASHLSRGAYVDQAVDEMGWPEEGGIYRALMMGQYMERVEIAESLKESFRGELARRNKEEA